MTAFQRCAFLIVMGLGCRGSLPGSPDLQPPPVQQPSVVHELPLDGSVLRDHAALLPSVRPLVLPRDPSTFETSRLLADGTLYRLELDGGATLVRFDDVTATELNPTRIPLVAPPGQEIRSENGRLRVATSTPGLSIDRNRRGSVWWEEDGPKGRHIEFRIDGDRAEMVSPGAGLDDPHAPVAHRFDVTPDRELSYRLTTGAVDVGGKVPRASLGGRGFSVAVAQIGRWDTEAFAQLPAIDLPHVDAGEPAPGLLTLTVGFITDRGHVAQVTYDSQARTWRDHRPLVVFPEAQTVEVADVGAAGVLAVLGLPWNGVRHDPETGLYWIRPGQPVRHLLQRIRELRTVTLPDGFIALFQDEFRRDRKVDDPSDMLVLRAQGDRLALYRFPRPSVCGSTHFVWLGGSRFLATFCSYQAVEFEVPDAP